MSSPNTPSLVAVERLTWEETRYLIRSDFERLAAWYGSGTLAKRVFWFLQPNFQALFLYRLYRHLFVNGWRKSSRLLALHAQYMTGVEISPATSIGPACLIAHASGIIVFGKIGARCSFFAQCGTGGGFGEEDVGGGPGYPVVGDDVEFGVRAFALGPIRIGNRAKLGPTAFVTRDLPEGATVLGIPTRVLGARTPSAATKDAAAAKDAATAENDVAAVASSGEPGREP